MRKSIRALTITAVASLNQGVLYTAISAGMILARRFLTARGAEPEFADRYGSAFGRTAAKTFREQRGTEPCRAWSLVNGVWRRVMGYRPEDLPVLDTALALYPRTAHLALAVAA